jgi:hypothetical protein
VLEKDRVKAAERKTWLWRAVLIVSIFLALDMLVDLKYWVFAIFVVWIAALALSLHRIRRNQEA